MVLARLFDDPAFRQEVSNVIKPRLGNAGRVGFPAVLGLKDAHAALQHLQVLLGVPVFEISGLPPSVPGIRLQNILVSAIEQRRGVVSNGMLVTGSINDGTSILSVHSEAASRHVDHHAKLFVLATGGFLGGGITITNNDYTQEGVFNLAVSTTIERPFLNQFISPQGHPRFRAGIRIDHSLQPTDQADQPLFSNLYTAGSLFQGCDSVRERSLEGIALATAFRVAEVISKEGEE
jgi:glycerol-3-phosphate dehydrogenase subunit B